MFTRDFIERVKQATNLVDLIGEYTTLHRHGDWWTGKCPHKDHHDDTPSFTVKRWPNGTLTWACFGCQDLNNRKFSSDCFGFIQWMHSHDDESSISFADAVRILAKRANIMIKQDPQYHKYQGRFSYNKITAVQYNLNLSEKYGNHVSAKYREYLYNRGLNDSDIKTWKIGLCQDKYGIKITFPLIDRNHNVLGFSARVMEGKGPKYINSPNSEIFQKSKYLYGIHKLDHSDPYIRITEGVFDVILAHKHGVSNVVCTLGTAFTEEHAKLCKALNKIPVFIFDGDAAGYRAIRRAVDLCNKIDMSAMVCSLPYGMDLADLSQANCVREYVNVYTMSLWMYRMAQVSALYETDLHEAEEDYNKIPDDLKKFKEIIPLIKLKLQRRRAAEIKSIYSLVPEKDKPYFKSYVAENFRGVYYDLYSMQSVQDLSCT